MEQSTLWNRGTVPVERLIQGCNNKEQSGLRGLNILHVVLSQFFLPLDAATQTARRRSLTLSYSKIVAYSWALLRELKMSMNLQRQCSIERTSDHHPMKQKYTRQHWCRNCHVTKCMHDYGILQLVSLASSAGKGSFIELSSSTGT